VQKPTFAGTGKSGHDDALLLYIHIHSYTYYVYMYIYTYIWDVREQRLRGVNPPIVVVAAWGWLTRVSLADNHSNDIKGGLTPPDPHGATTTTWGG